ncbi:MAG TPA: hypothetical protein VN605_07435, partial [Thermoanaerobaculia bacterium]|nr:hypothetical protein [Thermoanaerobaculia bacterium]
MSSIALELHEVLEQEYVSMGKEAGSSPDGPITAADIRNADEAAKHLGGIAADGVVGRLERLRTNVDLDDADNPLRLYARHERLSAATRRLLESYASESEATRLRINRRILDDLLGNAIRASVPMASIAADQIVDL